MGAISAGSGLLGGLFGGKKPTLTPQQKQLFNQLSQFMTQDQALRVMYAAQVDPTLNKMITEGSPFLEAYAKGGNPLLPQLQRQTAENIEGNYNNEAGKFAEGVNMRGYGFSPSGITAAGYGDLGRAESTDLSTGYLNNLLSSENLKYQAGLANVGVQENAIGQKLKEADLFNPASLAGAASSAAGGAGGYSSTAGNAITGAIGAFNPTPFPSSGGGSTATSNDAAVGGYLGSPMIGGYSPTASGSAAPATPYDYSSSSNSS